MSDNIKWPTFFLAEKLKEIKPCLIKYKITKEGKQQNLRYFERKIIERIVKDGESWWGPITQNMGELQLRRTAKWSFIAGLIGTRKSDVSPEELLWAGIWNSFLCANMPPQRGQIKELKSFLKALDGLVFQCPLLTRAEFDRLKIETEFRLKGLEHHAIICQKGPNQLRDAFVRFINNALRCSRDNDKNYNWKFASISQIADLSSTVLGQKIDKECVAGILSRYQTSQKLHNFIRSTSIAPSL